MYDKIKDFLLTITVGNSGIFYRNYINKTEITGLKGKYLILSF
jgi:hypothetical protein